MQPSRVLAPSRTGSKDAYACAGAATQLGCDLGKLCSPGTFHGSQAQPQQRPRVWEWLLLIQCPLLHVPKAVADGFILPRMRQSGRARQAAGAANGPSEELPEVQELAECRDKLLFLKSCFREEDAFSIPGQ